MIANAYAYRTIIPDRHIILGDGVVIEARKDDPDSYLVMTGDGKRKDGYLAVIITLSDGFPLIGDLVNIRGRNDFKTVNEESNRRLRKYELLANFLVSDRKDRKNIVKVSRDRIRKETEMSLFTKLAELLINNGVLRHGDIFSGDSVYGHKTVRELLAKHGITCASPINEGNQPEPIKFVYRLRDAAITLLAGVSEKDFLEPSDCVIIAEALMAILSHALRELETPIGSIPMRYVDALIGVSLDLIDALLMGRARRMRSSIAEGLNGILKTPFNLVNAGKKCLSKGYHNVRRLLHRQLIALQIIMLGDKIRLSMN